MLIRKRLLIVISCWALALCAVAQNASAPQASKAKPIFPETFAGWVRGAVQTSADPASVDPAQTRVLKEYGFTDSEQANYTKDGRTLKLKAARFKDATGAYGAFTFYREPKMQNERVGSMAVSRNERVLFFRDNVLVDATFDHVTAMSASELRELAGMLPGATGGAAQLPTLPQYLPREKMVANSGRYILGPAAYETLSLPVAPQLIAFDKDPEILTAKMSTHDGVSDMLIISYPTPQIAIERARAFEAANPHDPNSTYEVKRSGPLVAVVVGNISQSDAKGLLAQVNYEAEVTENQPTFLNKKDNIGNLVIAALSLAFVIFIVSLGSGLVFGFGRSILSKLLPRRFAPKSDEAEFIRLDLR